MAQKAELLAAFAQTGEVLDDFLASRSADEHGDPGGRKDDYSAKELVALTGFWMRYMVERMAFYARGDEPPRNVDFDALNRDEIARQVSQSWDAIAQATRADLAALVAAVEQSSEAFLLTPNYYGDYPPSPLRARFWPMASPGHCKRSRSIISGGARRHAPAIFTRDWWPSMARSRSQSSAT
jgi:hypothetical protein